MRKIRVMEHVSLDGIMEPEGDNDYAKGGWQVPYRSAEGAATVAALQGNGFDLLLGRRTYDLFAAFWPTMQGGPFAANMNAATKHVVTHRGDGLTWGPVQQVAGDGVDGVRALKASDGPDLVVAGSAMLATALLEHDLVDELVLAVYPLLLGHGKRCLPTSGPARGFTLIASQATPTGVLLNSYRSTGTVHP